MKKVQVNFSKQFVAKLQTKLDVNERPRQNIVTNQQHTTSADKRSTKTTFLTTTTTTSKLNLTTPDITKPSSSSSIFKNPIKYSLSDNRRDNLCEILYTNDLLTVFQ
jgi:hypothetical protein